MDAHQIQSSSMKFPKYNEYRASTYCKYFSLPDSIIYYIAKNPRNRQVYQNIIQTCKYFFIKCPILIFHCLYFDDENGWLTCVNESCRGPKENQTFRKIQFNVEKLQSKIGIVYSLKVHSSLNSSIASLLFEKLYSGKVKDLVLDGQKISMNTFLMIKQERVLRCSLKNCSVFYENGNEASCGDIIANLTELKIFDYRYEPNIPHNFSKTASELLQLSVFKNLSHFTLSGINDTFDIDKFYEFLKNNQKMAVRLDYKGILSAVYKNKLQSIADDVLDTAETARKYKPFFIQFNGQLRRKALYDLYK